MIATQRKVSASAAQAAAQTTATSTDKMGVVVTPSVANKAPVRTAAIALSIAVAALSGKVVPGTIAIVCHLMAAATWLGMNVWVTFVAGIVMFKNMPRQTFGKVQSKLFPINFGITVVCCACVLATVCMGPMADVATMQVKYTAGLGLVTSLANLLFIEPAATKVLFQRYDLENSSEVNVSQEKRKELTKKFGMLHGLSSMTALGTVAAAFAHFVWLGRLVQGGL